MKCKPILVVEDDAGIRAVLEAFFTGEGYPVQLAENGKVALALLAEPTNTMPGLILLDFMMPVMDGPTFLQELRKYYPHILLEIPILITSAGFSNWIQLKETIQTTGYLKKPFDLDELAKITKKHCESK